MKNFWLSTMTGAIIAVEVGMWLGIISLLAQSYALMSPLTWWLCAVIAIPSLIATQFYFITLVRILLKNG